ncbi:hypothetical protein C8R45DRAFT_1069810 [Mycena sanguinolenta]|nr:hypothetical protein C8R45DRAFT_1069810 [Mycena sanguinolenta]
MSALQNLLQLIAWFVLWGFSATNSAIFVKSLPRDGSRQFNVQYSKALRAQASISPPPTTLPGRGAGSEDTASATIIRSLIRSQPGSDYAWAVQTVEGKACVRCPAHILTWMESEWGTSVLRNPYDLAV